MRYLLVIALACATAAAEPPPIDVHVDVTVVPPDPLALERAQADRQEAAHAEATRAARLAPKPHWIQLSMSAIPCACTISDHPDAGGSALRARIEIDRGLITVTKGNYFVPVHWIAGLDVGRATTTDLDANDLANVVIARDVQAMLYGGIAIGSSRFEMQTFAGAGVEHSTGTIESGQRDMTMFTSDAPVVELAQVFLLRVHGPVGVLAGVGLTGHLGQYQAYDGRTFMRSPAVEAFAGLAVATY